MVCDYINNRNPHDAVEQIDKLVDFANNITETKEKMYN